jgi:hypothetical protein
VPSYRWEVTIPGKDLRYRLTSDYLVGGGERLSLDDRGWLVGRIDFTVEREEPAGLVSVVPPGRSLP